MENNVGIVGSRNFTDYKLFCKVIDEWTKTNGPITKIISGGCRGADTMAERYAKEWNIPAVVFNAEWEEYGKSAGFVRNKKIVEDSTCIIAFPSKNGKGTQNTIELAKERSIDVFIQPID